MGQYDGIKLPKIYGGSQSKNQSFGEVIANLLPSLANAYISGIRQEESKQLQADTKLYSSLAASTANFQESSQIVNVLEKLITERDEVARLGDSVRASYIDASIASVQPYLITKQKQELVSDLIVKREDSMNALEGTPGYEGEALKLMESFQKNIDEYSPYFNKRMVNDINNQQEEMQYRLSALSALDNLDVDKDKIGINFTEENYASNEAYYLATQAKDNLKNSMMTDNLNIKQVKDGLNFYQRSLEASGISDVSELREQKIIIKDISTNLLNKAKIIDSNLYVPNKFGENILVKDKYSLKVLENLNTSTSVSALKNVILNKKTINQIQNNVTADMIAIISESSPEGSFYKPVASKKLKGLIEEWKDSGKSIDSPYLKEIHSLISPYEYGTEFSMDNYKNLNYPGTKEIDANTKVLMRSYIDYLKVLKDSKETLQNSVWTSEKKNNQNNNYIVGAKP